MTTYSDDVEVFRGVYADDLRLVVDGLDVTDFRADDTRPSLRTEYAGYQLQEPYVYGPATFRFPQISGLEHRRTRHLQPADLKWLYKGAKAKLIPVIGGEAQTPIWRGFIGAITVDHGVVRVECPGEATGILSYDDRQTPVFRQQHDVGFYVSKAFRDHNLKFRPQHGPDTGIILDKRGSGESYLDYLNGILADAQEVNGDTWTVGRNTADTAYELHLKDTTTVHATVFYGMPGVQESLVDDMAEQPNTYYGNGIAPDGHKWVNAVIPGITSTVFQPAYPISGGGSFGLGTTNADTVHGDGISILNQKLIAYGFLDVEDASPTFTEDTQDAVEDLQDRAGLPVTGVVNGATWDALYDVAEAGYTIKDAQVLPLVQDKKLRRWNRTGNGNLKRQNPDFDPSAIAVARTIGFGILSKKRATRWCRRDRNRLDGANWVGTITLDGADIFQGDYEHGDPDPVLLSRIQLRAGQNIMLRGFDGDTLFHIAGINVDGDEVATLAVDTQARDLRNVGEIVARNRESRRHRGREFRQTLRTSDRVHDAITGWFEQGGKLGDDVFCAGGQWTVVPIVGGQEGTVARLRLHLDQSAFYCAVFGEKVNAKWLDHNVGNPGGKDADGNLTWATNAELRKLRNRRVLLYAAGTEDEPCGYGDKRHTNDAGDHTDAPVTGVFEDDAGFSYRCFDQPVLWLAVYAFQPSQLKSGRVMWQQIEEGT